MTDRAAALRAELAETCESLSPESLERVLEFARARSVARKSGEKQASPTIAPGEMARFLEEFREIGRGIPNGLSVVDALTAVRNEEDLSRGANGP